MRMRKKNMYVTKQFFSIGLLLFTATVANASHSVIDKSILTTSFDVPYTAFATTHFNTISARNSELTAIGRELHNPPLDSADLHNTEADQTKTLPPVPPPYLMALTGFLCISLIRDRKVWLALLAAVLGAGQTGFQAIPQLALRIGRSRNHIEQKFSTELICPYCLENSTRLRSDIEGTRYIGLLHHLGGIPDISLIRKSRFSIPDSQLLRVSGIQHRASKTNTYKLAISSKHFSLNSLFTCWAYQARLYILFSPAFIFNIIPRGPPNFKCVNFSSYIDRANAQGPSKLKGDVFLD